MVNCMGGGIVVRETATPTSPPSPKFFFLNGTLMIVLFMDSLGSIILYIPSSAFSWFHTPTSNTGIIL